MDSIKAVGLNKLINNKKTEPEANNLFSGVSFQQRLNKAVGQVNRSQHVADDASEAVIKGELGVHEGMMALQEADLSLRFLNQVRSKALAAYQEIMRMQF